MVKVFSIIAIDDSRAILAFVERALPASRFRVLTAATLEEGQDLIKNHFPDLILLDRDIDGKDGLTLLRQLRQNPAYDNVPVVMVTANKSQESVSECLRAGASDYLGKPFDQRNLLDRVARALERAARLRTAVSGKVAVSRSHRRTAFEFPGGINAGAVADFTALLQGPLGAQSRQDFYIFDLRAQPELTREQATALANMARIADSSRVYVLAGRNFARLLEADMAEERLFLSESDLEDYMKLHGG